MPRNNKIGFTAFIGLCAFCALCVGGASRSTGIRSAPAAPPPAATVSLTPAQAGSFEDALKALAAQGKVGFVAEGIPLRPHMPKSKVPPALSGELSLEAAVDQLAEFYDYEVARRDDLFVLKKRYSDPADLPGVTREEYTLALQDIVRLLSTHGPHPPLTTNTAFVLDFAKSVTPEQQEAMRDKGLLVSALTPAQQAQLWRMELNSAIEIPLRGIKDALFRLRQTPTIVLRKGKLAGQTGFGYEFVDTYKRTVFWPINGGFDVSAIYTGADSQDKERQDKERRDAQGLPLLSAVNWTAERTLAGVVSGLNARAGSATDKPLVVDAALAAKPITLVGAGTIAPARILTALADVYGLRITTDEDGTQHLTRRAARAARTVADLPENVRRLFPEPLIRALHIADVENLRERQIQLRIISRNPKTPQDERVRVDQEHDRLGEQAERWTTVSPALGLKSGLRLRASVEPRLETPDKASRAVAVGTLGAAEQSAFALSLIAGSQTDIVQTLSSFFHQEPNPVLTHWDNAYLQCGPYQQGEKQMYEVKVSVTRTNADSSTDTFTGGITGINYPGP